MIIRAYLYRCYPTAAQARTLSAWQTICHEVQRLCIVQRRIAESRQSISVWGGAYEDRRGERRERWHRRQFVRLPGPTWARQSCEVTELRAACPELRACPRDVIDAVVKRVDEAYQRMWKERKNGNFTRPRWADRASDVGLQFRGQLARGTQVVADGGRRTYWRLASSKDLGPLAVRMHRPLPDGAITKQAHLTRRADGWYISLVCAVPDEAPMDEAAIDLAGYNLNCRHDGARQMVAARDDGHIYRIDDADMAQARRLATLQKLVDPRRRTRGAASAADPKSARTAKRRERIARLSQRAARQREHQQQFVAKRIVQTANTIAVEDTDYAALARVEARRHQDGERRVKRLTNRSMRRAAPGQLRQLIDEKAAAAGRAVVRVSGDGITQICSACGHRLDPPIGLDIVRWTCPQCGAIHQRDANAAQNVKRRAE